MITKRPLPPRHVLSKSTFVRGCQCTKSLWLYKHRYDLRDTQDEGTEAVFLQGADVGMLARELFPSGVDATPFDHFHYREAVADTARYIQQGYNIIFEAAFQYEGVMCAIDVLVRFKGKWYGYEIKSSTSVKEQFVQDAALQYYVITNAGLELEDIFLVHLNKSYIRKGSLQLKELFTKRSIKDRAIEMQPYIAEKAEELKGVALQKEIPEIGVGEHCSIPYSCDFSGFCYKKKEHNEAELNHEMISLEHIILLGDNLHYPLYSLDLKTYMKAVPEYDGHWPYRQIPFLFSMHRQDGENESLQEEIFLAKNNCDPSPELVEQLVQSLGSEGSIIVLNAASVYVRLRELKNDYPQYAEELSAIQKRLAALPIPYQVSDRDSLGADDAKQLFQNFISSEETQSRSINTDQSAAVMFHTLSTDKDEKIIASKRKHLMEYGMSESLFVFNILKEYKRLIESKWSHG